MMRSEYFENRFTDLSSVALAKEEPAERSVVSVVKIGLETPKIPKLGYGQSQAWVRANPSLGTDKVKYGFENGEDDGLKGGGEKRKES